MKKQILILVIFAIPMLLTFQNCQRSQLLALSSRSATAQPKEIPNVDKSKSTEKERTPISSAIDSAMSEQESASKAFERKPQNVKENSKDKTEK